jgi:hypothetical protein
MSSTLDNPNAPARELSLEDLRQFLYREARFLDDKEWDNWLALYAPNVEFWMPSWDDDDQLVTDPQTEMGSRIESSGSGPSGRAQPACRSRGPHTTSATSRFWSRKAAFAGYGSIG